MASKKIGETRKALLKKGFSLKQTDHEIYVLLVDGQQTQIWTKLSRQKTGDDLQRNVIKGMIKQMHLHSETQLFEFISCSLSEDQYLDILREQHLVL